jgi:hypothetical protein
MPAASGERFSSQSMSDCEFCPPERRGFRTTRQCSGCSRFLCLVCRPALPQVPFLCPECGGGALEDAMGSPGACIERLSGAGRTVPFWLHVLHRRMAAAAKPDAEELLVPE